MPIYVLIDAHYYNRHRTYKVFVAFLLRNFYSAFIHLVFTTYYSLFISHCAKHCVTSLDKTHVTRDVNLACTSSEGFCCQIFWDYVLAGLTPPGVNANTCVRLYACACVCTLQYVGIRIYYCKYFIRVTSMHV